MKQVNNRKKIIKEEKIVTKNKPKFKYGTSKLEKDFANNFLSKLGVKYEYQYEAKDIGRFYDFYLPDSRVLIEIDGDYW